MRGSGAPLVTTAIVADFPVPVPAVSTEVRELQSGSPSIISISQPSNCLLLLNITTPAEPSREFVKGQLYEGQAGRDFGIVHG